MEKEARYYPSVSLGELVHCKKTLFLFDLGPVLSPLLKHECFLDGVSLESHNNSHNLCGVLLLWLLMMQNSKDPGCAVSNRVLPPMVSWYHDGG